MSTQKSEDISESAVVPVAAVASGAGKSKDLFADDDPKSDGSLAASEGASSEDMDKVAKDAEAEVTEKVRNKEES